MLETHGNLWDFHAQGHWVCVTTNGIVKPDGRLVMGAGLAKQALQRFPGLDANWGWLVREHGLSVIIWQPTRLIAFPSKYNWRDNSDLTLIQESARQLVQLTAVPGLAHNQNIYLPPVGCGLGQLKWPDVKATIEPILTDDHFIVVVP